MAVWFIGNQLPAQTIDTGKPYMAVLVHHISQKKALRIICYLIIVRIVLHLISIHSGIGRKYYFSVLIDDDGILIGILIAQYDVPPDILGYGHYHNADISSAV